jgi:hypothetical protein
MKKFVSLFLVFSMLTLSVPLTAKERKGADLIVQRKDGTQVRGELIAVKVNSLLLMERESGTDVSIDISEIKTSRIHRNTLIPATIGLIAGIVVGTEVSSQIESTQFMDLTPSIVGLGIALAGLVIGAAAGADTTIQIEGKSKLEIQEILGKLRKKARVKNSQ